MSFVFTSSYFSFYFILFKAMKKLKKDQANTNDIMEKKIAALDATNVELQEQLKRQMANAKRREENSDLRYSKLQEKLDGVVTDMEALLVKMEDLREWEKEAFQIRHTDQRYTCRLCPSFLQKTSDNIFGVGASR